MAVGRRAGVMCFLFDVMKAVNRILPQLLAAHSWNRKVGWSVKCNEA